MPLFAQERNRPNRNVNILGDTENNILRALSTPGRQLGNAFTNAFSQQELADAFKLSQANQREAAQRFGEEVLRRNGSGGALGTSINLLGDAAGGSQFLARPISAFTGQENLTDEQVLKTIGGSVDQSLETVRQAEKSFDELEVEDSALRGLKSGVSGILDFTVPNKGTDVLFGLAGAGPVSTTARRTGRAVNDAGTVPVSIGSKTKNTTALTIDDAIEEANQVDPSAVKAFNKAIKDNPSLEPLIRTRALADFQNRVPANQALTRAASFLGRDVTGEAAEATTSAARRGAVSGAAGATGRGAKQVAKGAFGSPKRAIGTIGLGSLGLGALNFLPDFGGEQEAQDTQGVAADSRAEGNQLEAAKLGATGGQGGASGQQIRDTSSGQGPPSQKPLRGSQGGSVGADGSDFSNQATQLLLQRMNQNAQQNQGQQGQGFLDQLSNALLDMGVAFQGGDSRTRELERQQLASELDQDVIDRALERVIPTAVSQRLGRDRLEQILNTVKIQQKQQELEQGRAIQQLIQPALRGQGVPTATGQAGISSQARNRALSIAQGQ